MQARVVSMTNLAQPIIRNARHISQIKSGKFSSRATPRKGVFQYILRALRRRFFVFGIFTPVGVFSIKGAGFHMQRGFTNIRSIQFSIQCPRRSFLNEKEIINFNIGGSNFDNGVHLAGVGG